MTGIDNLLNLPMLINYYLKTAIQKLSQSLKLLLNMFKMEYIQNREINLFYSICTKNRFQPNVVRIFSASVV